MKKVLVILVTFNGMKWLELCLDSVRGYDLFVVDNDSSDGSADFVESRCPGARIIRSAENLGFSKANNLGLEWALSKGYQYAYLINQDAWLEDGALEMLVKKADESPSYALLSPLQMTAGFKDVEPRFQKDKTPPAAHWLLRMDALKKVGLFNGKLFPHWGQDDDWCNRARFCGYEIGIVPNARGVHDRELRKEPKEVLIRRDYVTASLVRFANPAKSKFATLFWFIAYTVWKSLRYRTFEVFKEAPSIIKKSF